MARKILAVVLVMAVMVTVFTLPVLASNSDKWAGWTRISTAEDLRLMANSRDNFYLTNDIDLRNYGLWLPISGSYRSFSGTFDGNGYAIRNLSSTSGGLFGELNDATIKNLGLLNVDVLNNDNAGALANNVGGTTTIENCYVTGKVESTSDSYSNINRAGGLIGIVYGWGGHRVAFKNCINRASVTSKDIAGGFLGSGTASFINCVNAGSVKGDSDNVGGVMGYFNGRMESTYNHGSVSSVNSSNKVHAVGGLAGSATSNIIMRDCATTGRTAIGNPAENSTATARTNVPIDDFKKQETYKGFNFDRIWYINPEVNNGFPILRTMMRFYEIPDGTGNSGSGKAATGVRFIINVKEGGTLQLGAMLNPTDSTDTVTYASNKTSVASVNNSGLVTARAKGTADITVTAGKAKQTIRIRVT